MEIALYLLILAGIATFYLGGFLGYFLTLLINNSQHIQADPGMGFLIYGFVTLVSVVSYILFNTSSSTSSRLEPDYRPNILFISALSTILTSCSVYYSAINSTSSLPSTFWTEFFAYFPFISFFLYAVLLGFVVALNNQ